QVRARVGEVLLVDLAGPGLGDPDVPAGQSARVVLVVVLTDDPGVALLGQPVGGLVPVIRRGLLGRDADRHHAEVADLFHVREHADLALVGRVAQVVEAGRRRLDVLRVVGDSGNARLPRNAVDVALVERLFLVFRRRVGGVV